MLMKQVIRNLKKLTIAAMNKIWKIDELSTKKKQKFFNAYLMPILLYNCRTWTLTKIDETSLNSSHHRLLKRVVGVFWAKNIELKTTIHHNKNALTEPDHHSSQVHIIWSYFELEPGQTGTKSYG